MQCHGSACLLSLFWLSMPVTLHYQPALYYSYDAVSSHYTKELLHKHILKVSFLRCYMRGATTFSLKTLSMMKFNITTLSQ